MILFHGSKKIIERPAFGEGNAHNDYGLGFYCTEDIELAKEWACPESKAGFANAYDINIKGLKILDLSSEEYDVLNWIAVLLKFRTFELRSPISIKARDFLIERYFVDPGDYDIVIGYRADDSYFAYAKDFINNTISKEKLSEAIALGNLGKQVVIRSKKAFGRLEFTGYELVDTGTYYRKRKAREIEARKAYLESDRGGDIDGTYIRDIIRRESRKR